MAAGTKNSPKLSSRPRRRASEILVCVDTGGTFTDLVAVVGGRLRFHKAPSTPHDPGAAVIEGIAHLLGDAAASLITYGSTVATNALLEKKGARVALITNAGFEDLIEIGRQNRSDIYALAPERPEPLIARSMRFGLAERTFFDGGAGIKLAASEVARIKRLVARSKAESFAVCLLHSHISRKSEEAVAKALSTLGRPVSVSHRLLSEYREYERFSTTVVNAYVAPRMQSHLVLLERRLRTRRLRIMQSAGSAIGPAMARNEPVRTLLSGPAAGVVGAATLARTLGADRFITFDMGGTSTDVSLFDGEARIRTLSYPGGYAVRTPAIDIHTVGAGGGSIARIDEGGSLKVGPESAGAEPGPACYGRGGTAATVTDANCAAGRLIPANFLGGRLALRPELAERTLRMLGRAMGASVIGAAHGVIRVVNANMERAVRLITIERGFDPREFALLAFGGAGPMHGCELAQALGIRHVILPGNPGLLCAWGALSAAIGCELSAAILETTPAYSSLLARGRRLIGRARSTLIAQGAIARRIVYRLFVDARYRGQSYEIEVPLSPAYERKFRDLHRLTFGHAAQAPIEVVNIRLRAAASEIKAPIERIARNRRTGGAPAPLTHVRTLVGATVRKAPVYERAAIAPGARIRGPLIVTELSATAYVSPEFTMRADDYGNLHLEMNR